MKKLKYCIQACLMVSKKGSLIKKRSEEGTLIASVISAIRFVSEESCAA